MSNYLASHKEVYGSSILECAYKVYVQENLVETDTLKTNFANQFLSIIWFAAVVYMIQVNPDKKNI